MLGPEPRHDIGGRTEDGSVERSTGLPERLGPYRIEGLLGRGGMGEVYRAFDPRLQRHVALKRILPGRHGAKARARFWREARALAAVHHPDLVVVHDIGEDGADLYLAMELVAGTPLSELQGRPWTPAGAVALGVQAARALGAAHAAGIVHRDIKPSNLIVQPDGRTRVVDFGLARRAGDDEEAVTASHAIVGTINYMAPEQVSGGVPSPATDVYALGCVLYALLTGQPPHAREQQQATVAAIVGGLHRPLGEVRPDVPQAVAQVIERALSLDVAARPADGAALADALEAAAKALTRPLGVGTVRAELALVASSGAVPLVDTARAMPVVAPAAKRSKRRLVVAALLALVAAGASVAVARFTSCDAAPPVVSSAARLTVAVYPLEAEPGAADADVGEMGELVAAGLREYLDEVPERVTTLSAQELATGGDDVDLTVRGSVREEGGNLVVEAQVVAPDGNDDGFDVTVTGSRRDPLALARALHAEIGKGLSFPERKLPTITTSKEAWRALVAAREADLLGNYRALEKQVGLAFRAHPDLLAAKLPLVELEAGYMHIDKAKELLREILAQPENVSARDASRAQLTLYQLDGNSEEFATWLEAHLQRWPHDLGARVLELHAIFVGRGAGSLSEAIPYAEGLLRAAPTVPIVASKLVRALGWTGRSAEIDERLARQGLRADDPRFAVTFGEAALYQGDYEKAERLMLSDRSDDGQTPLYALHMAIAAEMLAGDCGSAAAHAKSRLEIANAANKPLWIDWTYYLWLNALICDGDPAGALLAVEEWRERTGTIRAPTQYYGYRWEVGLLADPSPENTQHILAEADAALTKKDIPLMNAVMPMLARIATDKARLRAWIDDLTQRLNRTLERWSATMAEQFLRTRHGLEARLAMLEGRVDEALATYASLAELDHLEPRSEADVFAKARWTRAYAEALDEAGRRTEAEVVWRRLLALGYERVLAMETTWAAKVRLGLTKTKGGGAVAPKGSE